MLWDLLLVIPVFVIVVVLWVSYARALRRFWRAVRAAASSAGAGKSFWAELSEHLGNFSRDERTALAGLIAALLFGFLLFIALFAR